MSNVTSWDKFKFTGQMENAGTPSIVVEFHPAVAENGDKIRDGVTGGGEVAFTVMVFVLRAPLGSLKVSVTV
jgi:hypothetical protein